MKITEDVNFVKIKEKYPHVSKSIEMFWGYPELVSYITRLLFDSRDGARKGFDYDVMVALAYLLDKHHIQFPQYRKIDSNPPPFTF